MAFFTQPKKPKPDSRRDKGTPRPYYTYRWFERNRGRLSDRERRDAIRAGKIRGSR